MNTKSCTITKLFHHWGNNTHTGLGRRSTYSKTKSIVKMRKWSRYSRKRRHNSKARILQDFQAGERGPFNRALEKCCLWATYKEREAWTENTAVQVSQSRRFKQVHSHYQEKDCHPQMNKTSGSQKFKFHMQVPQEEIKTKTSKNHPVWLFSCPTPSLKKAQSIRQPVRDEWDLCRPLW